MEKVKGSDGFGRKNGRKKGMEVGRGEMIGWVGDIFAKVEGR
jgi:hypothetical protein